MKQIKCMLGYALPVLLMFPLTGCNPDLQVAAHNFAQYGGQETNVVARLKNNGDHILGTETGYYATYRVLDSEGKEMTKADEREAKIPSIAPGETKNITLKVISPPHAGNYVVEAIVFQENPLTDDTLNTARGGLVVENDKLEEYAASIETDKEKLEVQSAQSLQVLLHVENNGSISWDSHGSSPVYISYHIKNEDGSVLIWDNPRTSFEQPVNTGQKTQVKIEIEGKLFPKPGNYQVMFDLVHEGVAWFSSKNAKTLTIPIEVK